MRWAFASFRAERVAAAALCVAVVCVSRPADAADQQASQTVAEILSDWAARRAEASSIVTEWAVIRQDRSARFSSVPSNGDRGNEPRAIVRLLMGQRGIRLESESFPPDRVTRITSSFDQDCLGTANLDFRFQTSLKSRFANGQMFHRLQPYAVIRRADREIHYWEGGQDLPPYAAIFPTGQGQQYASIPGVSLLMDAISHVLCGPSLSGDEYEPGEFRLLSEHRLVRGRMCDVLEYRVRPKGSSSDDSTAEVRRYWIDPRRDNLPLRLTIVTAEGVPRSRFAFDYDAEGDGTGIPSRVDLVQFHDQWGVHDGLTLVRKQLEVEARAPDDAFNNVTFSPGTLVTDFVKSVQYRIEADGSQQPTTMPHLASESATRPLGWILVSLFYSGYPIEQLLLKAVRWPGALVTASAGLVMYTMLIAVVRRRSSSRREDDRS